MFSVRAQSLEDAGPVRVDASPFHALMARRMCEDGVLRRLDCGRYVIAVRAGDLPALESMRGTATGTVTLLESDGVHIAEMTAFPDVLDAEMRCTLLHFPSDYRHPDAAAGSAPGEAATRVVGTGDDICGDGKDGMDGMDELMRAIGDALDGIAPPASAGRDRADVADVVGQMARDLPEIERILRAAAATDAA